MRRRAPIPPVVLAALLVALAGFGARAAGVSAATPAAPAAGPTGAVAAAPPAASGYPDFRLVESWPCETTLDHPDIPDAADVWPELINSARSTLDFAEFYVSDDPQGGGRLKPVLKAIEQAAKRGVQVRFLVEEKFYKTYPETVNRLSQLRNTTVRRLDSQAFNGGVMHAKYFIVDGSTSYLGSQNFDWRSLTHIQELGVAIRDAEIAAGLKRVFDFDWALAAAIPPGRFPGGGAAALVDSVLAGQMRPRRTVSQRQLVAQGDTLTYKLVVSPYDRLPPGSTWDEHAIIQVLDAARDSAEVQLLTYKPVSRETGYYPALDNALRRAATRGVKVRLLVADWCKRQGTVEYLKSLALFPGIEVRFMDIPPWTGGFVPFARVCHAKYLVVDGTKFWIGTGNWERDYFYNSRNVGVIGESRIIGGQLEEIFTGGWRSAYAEPVKPEVEYTPPRVSE